MGSELSLFIATILIVIKIDPAVIQLIRKRRDMLPLLCQILVPPHPALFDTSEKN